MIGLTQRQVQLLRFLQDYMRDHNHGPSFEEMRVALDLGSKGGVHRLLESLEERGYVRRLPHRARAIEVLTLKRPGAPMSPGQLTMTTSADLRIGIAEAAGVLAHRDGEATVATMLRRIADRLEHRPRAQGLAMEGEAANQ